MKSVKSVRREGDLRGADLEFYLGLEFKKRLRTRVQEAEKVLFHPGLSKVVGSRQNEPVGRKEVARRREEPGLEILTADSMLDLLVKNPRRIFFRGDVPIPRKPRYHVKPPP